MPDAAMRSRNGAVQEMSLTLKKIALAVVRELLQRRRIDLLVKSPVRAQWSAVPSAAWRQNVLTNTAAGEMPNLHLRAGAHTLTVRALDPGAILSRFELAFAGAQRAYGPVPETRISQ
jgi:hypothetical protein